MYQTAASQEERVFQWVRALNARARVPDVTIVLTVSIEEATRRRKARGEAPQIFDDESVQERVMRGYERLPELLPDESLYSVDTDRPEQVVAEEILRIVRSTGI